MIVIIGKSTQVGREATGFPRTLRLRPRGEQTDKQQRGSVGVSEQCVYMYVAIKNKHRVGMIICAESDSATRRFLLSRDHPDGEGDTRPPLPSSMV